MLNPPPELPTIGGLVISPLVGAFCAWRAERKWAKVKRGGRASSDVPLLGPSNRTARIVLPLGPLFGLLGIFGGAYRQRGLPPTLFESALLWAATLGVVAVLFAAVALARTGMVPEPNFRLTDNLSPRIASPLGSMNGDPELFDAREL